MADVNIKKLNEFTTATLSDSLLVPLSNASGTGYKATMSAVRDYVSADTSYYVCGSNADASAKSVTANGFNLRTGGAMHIKFTYANEADDVTLNVGGTGAYPLMLNGTRASSTNLWAAGDVFDLYFDGTNWQATYAEGGIFSTGEKVKAVGVSDMPIPKSPALIESQSISNMLNYFCQNLSLQTMTSLSTTDKYAIGADGEDFAYNTYCYKTYNVTGIKYVCISGRQWANSAAVQCCIAYAYGDNYTKLRGYTFGVGGTDYYNCWIELPDNAVYLKVAAKNPVSSTIISCKCIDQYLVDLIRAFDNPVAETLTSIEHISNTFIHPDGTLHDPSTTPYYVEKYDVEGYNYCYISGRQFNPITTAVIACAYDVNGNFMKAYTGKPGTNYVDMRITLPTGAKYLRVSSSTATATPPNPTVSATAVAEDSVTTKEMRQNTDYIPAYWQNYLDTQIGTIKSHCYTAGSTGDSFVFITDIHMDYNFGRSPMLIKYILENTPIKNIVIGGDLYTSASSTTEALAYIQKVANMYSYTDKVFAIRGNHDSGNSVTAAHYYAIFYKPLENLLTLNKLTYFHKDNTTQQIRYLFIDSRNNATLTTAEITWINERITELASGWTVVVFAHAYWNVTTGSSTPSATSLGSSLKSALDALVGNVNAKIAAVIVGHTHADRSVKSTKGYWIISTTCDANGTLASQYDQVTPTRTEGTTSEHVFDVCTIDTTHRTIYMDRIGGNGTNRTFTYD